MRGVDVFVGIIRRSLCGWLRPGGMHRSGGGGSFVAQSGADRSGTEYGIPPERSARVCGGVVPLRTTASSTPLRAAAPPRDRSVRGFLIKEVCGIPRAWNGVGPRPDRCGGARNPVLDPVHVWDLPLMEVEGVPVWSPPTPWALFLAQLVHTKLHSVGGPRVSQP